MPLNGSDIAGILLAYATACWSVMTELAPWLFVGAVAAGLLHGLVSPDLIQRRLRGFGGVVLAVIMGVPLPLCSCGVIPAGVGLKKTGASNGASVGFLIATPQTGVDSIAVAAGLLGWPFALYKVGAALVTGLVGGALVEVMDPGDVSEAKASESHRHLNVRAMFDHGLDVVQSIWGWLLFGILVSAALTVFLPVDAFGSLEGVGAVVALGVVLAASVPLYVCATASVPIAAALVAAGLPTGAALVFLMAGPATNVATVGAVWRTFGTKTLIGYLGTIIVGSVGLGLAYEPLFGRLSQVVVGHHEHTAWWGHAAAGLLVAAFIWFAITDLRQRLVAMRPVDEAERVIAVSGMTCGGCAARLKRTFEADDGVEWAEVSFDRGEARIKGSLADQAIADLILGAGFQITE